MVEPRKRAAVIKIEVDGHSTWALVDSGADMSMINQDFAARVIPKQCRAGSFGHVTEAGGGTIKVAGRAEVPFQIRTSQFVQPMAVIPGLVYQVIIGRDFCCRYATILDDKAGVFKIGKHEIKLPTYEELRPKRAKAITCAAVTIPPRSSAIIKIGLQSADGGVEKEMSTPWDGVLEPCTIDGNQDYYRA